ncbi:GDP-fucose protein O-fucosyltransferase 2 isoform X2 [Parasteatoda tepidariorum]|uniref:GDP-fucose protein O-fucosyltransferase 2 isoform X2 n=1 Tax=Parasteatoda tepidariorum TaxID=114398 RepID=UPI001C71D6AB|nr:GDP-fucose protein O-fucosyltransferase 2 isoform X2 [Parasteatoda tepidariorum]
MRIVAITLYIILFTRLSTCQLESCTQNNDENHCYEKQFSTIKNKSKRFLLYDVNPGEGFNLRRDVYMRIATLVKKLNEATTEHQWILVLPPWGPLYHWKSKNINFQSQIKWSMFFDLTSLKKYVPVIELHEFLNEHGPAIDDLYYLQHYAEGWTNGAWEERANIRECIEPPPYRKFQNVFNGWFWGFDEIYAMNFHCLSIQGYSSTLKKFLFHSSASAIMIDRAEVILHDAFGDSEYWMVRRSMVFSQKLISIGNDFRKLHLNSSDEEGKTILKPGELNSQIVRKAIGGPYISVHLRRRDFVKARPTEVPSIKFAAKQIKKKMKDLNLKLVFIATDSTESEFDELKKIIPEIKRFVPSKELHQDILDGGVAIIDQWICAHARYL